MKAKYCVSKPLCTIGRLLVLPALLMCLVAFGPVSAQAATSANATIFNEVTVNYTSGTQNFSASDDVSITVSTLAVEPDVSVAPTSATVAAGVQTDYVYTIKSNSNGPDTYTVTTVDSVDADVTVSTDNLNPGNSISLWGGIVVGSVDGAIQLPGGSVTGLVAGTSTVELSGGQYTVTAISAGTAPSSGTPEVYAQLTLTPIAPAPAIIAGSVAAGTQVGEYGTITLEQTAGTPTTQGTNGTHTTNLTFTTTETDAGGAVVTYTTSSGDSNEVVTTVTSPNITVTKYVRNNDDATANPGSGGVSINGQTYYTGGVTGKPGEELEYVVNIVNAGDGPATDVVFTDTLSPYTTYVGSSAQVDTDGDGTYDVTISGGETEGSEAGGIIQVSGGSITVQAGTGGDENVPQGGQIAGGGTENSVVYYRVTIN